MRILILEQRYTSPEEAGIGRFYSFGKEWIRQGHEVTVLAGMVSYISGEKGKKYRGKLFSKERSLEGIEVFRIFDSFPGYRAFLGRLLSYFSFCFLALLLSLFLRKPDIVVASSPPIFIGYLGYLIGLLKRTKFVFEIRDIWPDEAVELGFVKSSFLIKMSYWLEDFLHRKSDFIVVNSPGIKNFLTENKRVSEDKVAVVPNAADLEFSDKLQDFSLRNKMRWEGKTVVLYAGAMSIVYDFDLILEVAKEIKNPNILFVFVGDGRQRKVMEKKAEEEKLRNVIFLGAVPKIKLTEFVAASDICIASLKDMRFLKYVYATKLMSYMAGKKPIILAMEGVSAQLVCGKAKAGLCFNPKDQAGVKQAILELASDSAQREKLGQAGYEYAREHFDSKKLARSYLDILSEIAIGRQTPR